MESGLCPRTGRRKGFTQSRNRFNTTIEVLREFLKNGRYDWDKELALTREYVDDVMPNQIRRGGAAYRKAQRRKPAEGNHQQMAFGNQNILILDEPTRGIDVKTKSDIYHLIDRLTARAYPSFHII